MESFLFLFDALAYLNSGLLVLYAVLSTIVLRKSNNKIAKIVAFYLLFSCFFDVFSQIVVIFLVPSFFENSLFMAILYRLGELLIIGYLINKFWLKNKVYWGLIALAGAYLVYELFTYQNTSFLNYTANAQIAANILLVIMIAFNLIKQLQSEKTFSVSNQMLCMVFLTYFSVHLVYTVISNYIINQSFSNKGFTLFYCSYALLHIAYYFSLAFIINKKTKTPKGKTLY